MRTIDRYVIRSFAKVLLICFISLTGLFIVIDAMGNVDEFIGYGESQGGIVRVLGMYYGPRVLSFFDRTSALIALAAALFTVSNLRRSNEMVALTAAGVPVRRIVLPLILAAGSISLLASLNRETLLPQHRDALTRNAQNWLGEKERSFGIVYDYKTDIRLAGKGLIDRQQRIVEPKFSLPDCMNHFGRHILAHEAFYHPPRPDRPGGYLLNQVASPLKLEEKSAVQLEGAPVILTPRETSWLKPNQLFVISDITYNQLSHGDAWRQYSSTLDLIAAMRNASLDFGADARVNLHARFVRPLLDISLLLLGLPIMLSRRNESVFVAAAKCIGLMGVFFVVQLGCHGLGSNYLLRPDLAAWLPLIIFGPLAMFTSQPLFE